MAWKSELTTWISTLTDELYEIPEVLNRIEQEIYVDSKLKIKLNHVARLLESSIKKFIEKVKKMKELALITDKKIAENREEYLRVLSSADNFFNSFGLSGFQPGYVKSTFTHRRRIQSAKCIVEKTKGPQHKVRKSFGTLKITDSQVCKEVNKIVKEVNQHGHDDYEEKVERLEKVNVKFKAKAMFLKEEAQSNLALAQSLAKRLKKLEAL